MFTPCNHYSAGHLPHEGKLHEDVHDCKVVLHLPLLTTVQLEMHHPVSHAYSVQKQMRFFMENCQARLHWGKAGWDWLQPCFDGAAHYDKWCDFGCAVQV